MRIRTEGQAKRSLHSTLTSAGVINVNDNACNPDLNSASNAACTARDRASLDIPANASETIVTR